MVCMIAKTITRKKNTEIVKEELLNSLRESDIVEEQEFSLKNVDDKREAVDIIKHYEEIIKAGNKQTKKKNRYKVIERQMLQP